MSRNLDVLDNFGDLPFSVSPNVVGDVVPTSTSVAIKQSLFNILHTTPGDRQLNPDFGCNIKRFLFDPFDEDTARRIGNSIKSALTVYEKRIQIQSIRVIVNEINESYEAAIFYFIPSISQNDNLRIELQRL
jgi:phage baseplate assembly protein W